MSSECTLVPVWVLGNIRMYPRCLFWYQGKSAKITLLETTLLRTPESGGEGSGSLRGGGEALSIGNRGGVYPRSCGGGGGCKGGQEDSPCRSLESWLLWGKNSWPYAVTSCKLWGRFWTAVFGIVPLGVICLPPFKTSPLKKDSKGTNAIWMFLGLRFNWHKFSSQSLFCDANCGRLQTAIRDIFSRCPSMPFVCAVWKRIPVNLQRVFPCEPHGEGNQTSGCPRTEYSFDCFQVRFGLVVEYRWRLVPSTFSLSS